MRKKTRRGTSYALKLTHQGQRHFVYLGGTWDGWTEQRAEAERQFRSELLRRGQWSPDGTPAVSTAPAQAVVSRPVPEVTFETFAAGYLERRRQRLGSEKSRTDLEWRLGIATRFFGDAPVSEINAGDVDDLVTALLEEQQGDRPDDGRPRLSRRGLSNSSINKVVAALQRLMDDAVRRGLIAKNPVDDSSRLRERAPSRSWLYPHQSQVLLECAHSLEEQSRRLEPADVARIRTSPDSHVALAQRLGVSEALIRKIRAGKVHAGGDRSRHDLLRFTPLALLLGTGLRIAELVALDGGDIDLVTSRIHVRREVTTTEAGERSVPLMPFVLEALGDLDEHCPITPGKPLLRTPAGPRMREEGVRRWVLDPCADLARQSLLEQGRIPLGDCTPHALRRTFVSILAELEVPPRRAMALLGHADPRLTLRVYEQVANFGEDRHDLETLIGCSIDEGRAIMSGYETARNAGLFERFVTETSPGDDSRDL